MAGDLFDSPWKILIVAVVIIVLFGSKKPPRAARSLGQSMRILKIEVGGPHEDDPEAGAELDATGFAVTRDGFGPRCPGCSPSATCAPGPSNGWHRRWATGQGWMFSRSASRLGCTGSQPRASRVRVLDEGWSVAKIGPSGP